MYKYSLVFFVITKKTNRDCNIFLGPTILLNSNPFPLKCENG